MPSWLACPRRAARDMASERGRNFDPSCFLRDLAISSFKDGRWPFFQCSSRPPQAYPTQAAQIRSWWGCCGCVGSSACEKITSYTSSSLVPSLSYSSGLLLGTSGVCRGPDVLCVLCTVALVSRWWCCAAREQVSGGPKSRRTCRTAP